MFKSLKSILTVVTFLIVASLFFTSGVSAATKKSSTPAKSKIKNEKIIVYYFYSKPRCISCKKIESYTRAAVEELNNKKVEYVTVDLDNPANKHYSEKYKLFTKSVILSKQTGGKETKWKNLDAIWTKLNKEAEFKTYITTEIKNFGG